MNALEKLQFYMITHCTAPAAGFGLVHVKLTSTWAEHCPAYYLAVNLEKKQVVISIRGTAQVEDVITDLTALPRASHMPRKILSFPAHEIFPPKCIMYSET